VQEEPDCTTLARRIVRTSAQVKPGDAVVITGGKASIPAVEAVAIDVLMAGGIPQILLFSDRVTRSLLTEVPEPYLSQERSYFAKWIEPVDGWINVISPDEFFGPREGVAEQRLAKADEAYLLLTAATNQAGVRFIVVTHPTQREAERNGVPYSEFARMHWEAVRADYAQNAAQREALRRVLSGARRVRVTAPGGTDLSFSMGNRPVLGRLVVPRDRCEDEPVVNATLRMQNGRMRDFRAERGGECVHRLLAAYSGAKDRFGIFSIGLNPQLRVQGDFRLEDAAGMVGIGIGNNEIAGGENRTQSEWWFPVTRATVEVDGRMVVRDGQLVR
jgi:leucyl aminopeptidase (aminopeptidase T)